MSVLPQSEHRERWVNQAGTFPKLNERHEICVSLNQPRMRGVIHCLLKKGHNCHTEKQWQLVFQWCEARLTRDHAVRLGPTGTC